MTASVGKQIWKTCGRLENGYEFQSEIAFRLSLKPAGFLLPFDVIRVSDVMPLTFLFMITQNSNGGSEIKNFPRGQKMQIRSAVPTSVAVDPFQLQPLRRGNIGFEWTVIWRHGRRRQHTHRSAAHENLQHFLFCVVHWFSMEAETEDGMQEEETP